MIRHISWLGASLLALGTACVQADPLAFPASLQGKAVELAPNDPDYARAAVEYAVKPAGQGTAAKIATPHNPAIIYKPGDGVVSSGLAYVAVRACQAVVC